MRKVAIRLCLLALVSLPQLALADAYHCDGQVNYLGLNDGMGRLWISYGAIGMQSICAVDSAFNAVSANVCKAWLALLTAAQAQQKTIRMYYNTATSGNPTSCAGMQSWGEHTPYFIQTLD